MNNYFYTLLSDDHSSILSLDSNHSCNLSLNYKTGKDDFYEENVNGNFADELEQITITYNVSKNFKENF